MERNKNLPKRDDLILRIIPERMVTNRASEKEARDLLEVLERYARLVFQSHMNMPEDVNIKGVLGQFYDNITETKSYIEKGVFTPTHDSSSYDISSNEKVVKYDGVLNGVSIECNQ